MTERPAFIAHWSALEEPARANYRGSNEHFAHGAPLGRKLGLQRIGVHHMRVPPGRRVSYPHAESAEEEFVFVIDGHPDVWLDGHLHRLSPGDSVGFPAGTGIAHTFINNTPDEVRLLVVGEKNPDNSRTYPLNPGVRGGWNDAPEHPLGPHNGLPDQPS
jgi:uncharacterized cupin superfamily protein